MSDIQGGEAAAVETTTPPPSEAGFSSQQQEKPRDWDAEAKRDGWVPKDEFKGNPDEWRDAETWVKRGEEILPYVRKQNQSLKEELEASKKDFAERLARIERMGDERSKRERAAYEDEIKRIKGAQKQAVAAGDTETFDKLEQRREELTQELSKQPEKTEAKPKTEADERKAYQGKVKAFAEANSWYRDEPELADYANWWSNQNLSLNPDITFEDNMKATVEAVARKFPDRLGDKTAANGHAAVDGGGAFNNGGPRKDTLFAKLSPEAKAQCAKDVKAGLYKTNEDWARVYFG